MTQVIIFSHVGDDDVEIIICLLKSLLEVLERIDNRLVLAYLLYLKSLHYYGAACPNSPNFDVTKAAIHSLDTLNKNTLDERNLQRYGNLK